MIHQGPHCQNTRLREQAMFSACDFARRPHIKKMVARQESLDQLRLTKILRSPAGARQKNGRAPVLIQAG